MFSKNQLLLGISLILPFFGCQEEKPKPDITVDTGLYNNIENTLAFGLLDKIKGIWAGPIVSSTSAGNFPEWIVDFRPISSNQISAKNELNAFNDLHLSFFVAKYHGEYRLAFRNGGQFMGLNRITYFLADSVSNTSTETYYRFSEIKKGIKRGYSTFIFRNDSLYFNTYTNKLNSLPQAVMHETYTAKRIDTSACLPAVNHFHFPQKTLCLDITDGLKNQNESIFYSLENDFYPDSLQPYLGKTTITYNFGINIFPDPDKYVFAILTTQPLIDGFQFKPENLIFRSRYVMMHSQTRTFTFSQMHPGTYYLYLFYDQDNNQTYSSGDIISLPTSPFVLPPKGSVELFPIINFSIP